MKKTKKQATKKIIHLSDLHIGYGDLAERFHHVANAMIMQKQPANKYVVVITGDIVEDGFHRSHFDQAKVLLTSREAASRPVSGMTQACAAKRL